MVTSRWILLALLAVINFETVVTQDICRRFPFPQSLNTYSICQKLTGSINNQMQNIVINCADASIVELGKIEIGYRDRQCQGIISYIGCCFGTRIPSNSSIVCQSQVDITGTTNRLLEFRNAILRECRGRSSCTYQLSLQPLLEQVFTDAYFVYLSVDYTCSSDSMGPSTPKTDSSPGGDKNGVLITGWIVAAVIFVLFIVTIAVVVFLYRQNREKVQKCIPKSSLQKPTKPLSPLPSVPYDIRNSSYTALDDREYNTIPNDYEKIQMENSVDHEYLEPTAPSEYSVATSVVTPH
ncbi:hypothetical protein LOTGIDRAFT_229164 [Lottia gigantea]|uniref:SUEL-type lectin domain-containing protein n=1 Tax=Lottia gigantea TaxID=225164 RepID=V4BL23_LOTGI|nr:hypothetical protein LOTGIDRAFT_229164 [Lottia gigantea]ESO89289.1 hypothetical protein LOTGIDRAFT_229164 [Lottia gigantea]